MYNKLKATAIYRVNRPKHLYSERYCPQREHHIRSLKHTQSNDHCYMCGAPLNRSSNVTDHSTSCTDNGFVSTVTSAKEQKLIPTLGL